MIPQQLKPNAFMDKKGTKASILKHIEARIKKSSEKTLLDWEKLLIKISKSE